MYVPFAGPKNEKVKFQLHLKDNTNLELPHRGLSGIIPCLELQYRNTIVFFKLNNNTYKNIYRYYMQIFVWVSSSGFGTKEIQYIEKMNDIHERNIEKNRKISIP